METVIFERSPFVDEDAFYNCRGIRRVLMYGNCPKAAEGSSYEYLDENPDRSPFDDEVYEKAILYVREDQMEAYRSDLTWGKFKNIRDIEEYLAGIGPVNADAQVSYQVFDLSGILVRSVTAGENWRDGLASGVYIVRSSLGLVKKEYIR